MEAFATIFAKLAAAFADFYAAIKAFVAGFNKHFDFETAAE